MRIEMTKTLMLPLLNAVLFLAACGDDGGGDSGGDGGGTGGAEAGGSGDEGADDESGGIEPPTPDEVGQQCGSDVLGWQTRCRVETLTAVASDRGEIPGVPPIGEHTGRSLCCEGNPPIAEADAGCDDICDLEVCEAARIDHMNRCDSCGPLDCGFDMSKCLQGGAHTQIVTCAAPLQLPFGYTLDVSCNSINNETRNPDGSFSFLEQPTNDTMTDPPVCMPTGGLDVEPPRGLGQFKGSEGEGTLARVTWSMAGAGGEEQSEELDVVFEYAIVPCSAPAGECLDLTALELTLPETHVMGLTIDQARLAVIAVTEAPMIERGEQFAFSDGSIRVSMQAHANGYPLLLSGWNAGNLRGRLSPAGDQLSLTGLYFEFEDSVITAALEIDIQGQYDARRPNAQITHLTAPTSCQDALTLLATSWDDDQDPLTHTWWIRDVGTFSGPLVEVALPAGEHDVMLTSRDPSGLFDTAVLRYARRCQ